MDSPRIENLSRLPLDLERIFIAGTVQDDPRGSHTSLLICLSAEVDITRLQASIQAIELHFDVLRSILDYRGDEAFLSVAPTSETELPRVEECSGEVLSWAEQELSLRFEYGKRLARIKLARSPDGKLVLLLVVSRAVCDEWSLRKIFHELVRLYDKGPGEGLSAADPGIIARLKQIESQLVRDLDDPSLTHTVARIGTSLACLELPIESPRPQVFTGRGELLEREVPENIYQSLLQYSATSNVQLVDLVLTGYIATLQRWCNQDDFVVGLEMRQDHETVVGPSVGYRILTARHSSKAQLLSVIEDLRTQRESADISSLPVAPLHFLIQTLKPTHDTSRTPIFQTAVEVTTASLTSLVGGSVTFEPIALNRSGARADITLRVNILPSQLVLGLQYASDIISTVTAERLLNSLVFGLSQLQDSTSHSIGSLPLLSDAELQASIYAPTRTFYDAGKPAYIRFEEHASTHPNDIAVVMNGEVRTYDELDKLANRVAHSLRGMNIQADDLVGIYCERTIDMLVAVLGTHKAGGAYVPLDPEHPATRIGVILEDATPKVLITQKAIREACPAPQATKLLEIDNIPLDVPDTRLNLPVNPDGLAYVIFTSGSTGRPKGVEILHRAFTNFITSMASEPGMSEADRILSVTTLSFDIAGLELFLPLCVGGSVEICDRMTCIDVERLMIHLKDPAITLMQATPATWRMLMDAGWTGKPNLKVLCGGESFPPDLVQYLMSSVSEVWNVYGPTETTVWSTGSRLLDSKTPIPIGRPINNTNIYLLNACGERVPAGAVGEIWIGGDGVARGYRDRPELTAERFQPDPFSSIAGARMYGTGDLGRIAQDRRLICLGRVDFQVKIRGFRIELGDIESALLNSNVVREAVVVAADGGGGEKRLVAYLVVNRESFNLGELRNALRQELPAYMVPSAFVLMEQLPLNPSGKIDRKALPPPHEGEEQNETNTPVSFQDDSEATVYADFLNILRIKHIDLDTSFFDSGGDSLLAVRLMRKLESDLGRPVPLALLFSNPSVRSLATVLREGGNGSDQPRVVLLKKGTTEAKLFCIYGVALYQHLARALPEEISVYGVYLPIETEVFDPQRLARGELSFPSVKKLATLYVEAIRTIEPTGPYRVAGISFGGVVAYEVARQLREQQEKVHILVLLDAILPQSDATSRIMEWGKRVRRVALDSVARGVAYKIIKARLGARTPQVWSDEELTYMRDQMHEFKIERYARRLEPFDGNVLCAEAADRQGYDSTNLKVADNWRQWVRGKFYEVSVPGDHLEIIDKHNVAVFADALRPLL